MIPQETVVEIRRLFYGEHFTVGTIAATLGVHHETVERAIGNHGFDFAAWEVQAIGQKLGALIARPGAELSLQAGKCEVDGMMKEEQVTDEQLSKSNEPELKCRVLCPAEMMAVLLWALASLIPVMSPLSPPPIIIVSNFIVIYNV